MTERDRLAERHMGLVRSLCHRFEGRGVEYEELFSAGCLGLTKAINRFDGSRGTQFSTYAFPVIAGELKRLFRDGGAVRVSRSLRELSVKISRLNSESGGELTVSLLAERLNESPERIAEAIGSSRLPFSLSAGCGDEPPLEIPVDDIQEEITERLSLRQALSGLDESERRLISLRYFQNKTQTETAEVLHTSQAQVSRREKKILARVRKELDDGL